MDACVNGWLVRWTDVNGYIDGLMDGWIGGRIYEYMNGAG